MCCAGSDTDPFSPKWSAYGFPTGPFELTFVSENGTNPSTSAAMLCQLARFSVQITADPPGRNVRWTSPTK